MKTLLSVFALICALTVAASELKFNGKDCTETLQAALNSGMAKLTISKQSGPWLVSKPLTVPANIEIFFEDGAEIRAMDGHFPGLNDSLLKINGKNNITIRGKGILSMNRKEFQDASKYKRSEWRHSIEIMNSSNIVIDGLTIRGSGGDGIYVNRVKDIRISNILSDNHHRQGISVISAENLTIRDSIFSSTDGTAPMAGIDFEPNNEKEKLINCVVENCQFLNNAGAGIDLILITLTGRTEPISITFRNCMVKNNKRGITIMNTHMPSVKGSIVFENCRVEGSKEYTVNSIGQTAGGYSVTMKDCILNNTGAQNPAALVFTPGFVSGALGNLHLENVKVTDGNLFGFNSWKLYPLENLSGSLIHESGKTLDMKSMTEKSIQSNPLKSASIDLSALTPYPGTPGKKKQEPLRMRFSGTFLQYAEQGKEISVQAFFMPIGAGKGAVNFIVASPSGREIGKWSVSENNEVQTVNFIAQETGIYQFRYSSPALQGSRFESSHPGHGYQANNALSCNHVPGIMYFLVPAGIKEVAVKISGENISEHVTASLLNPQGTRVATVTKATEPQLLYHVRNNTSKDEVWTVQVHSAVDDFNIAIMGDAIPVLSDTPAGLFQLKR